MTNKEKAENRAQAERLADATADLVGHFVGNVGRLVTDVVGNSARVSQESQGLYIKVAKTYVREAVKTASKVAGAVSDAVNDELRELERRRPARDNGERGA